VFFQNPEYRHRQTDTAALYIYIYIDNYDKVELLMHDAAQKDCHENVNGGQAFKNIRKS